MNSSCTGVCCILCAILSFTASILGENLLLEYCKTGSIVIFFSEGETKLGDFTLARGEECLGSHLETATETSRRGQWHFVRAPKKWQIALRLGRASLPFISQGITTDGFKITSSAVSFCFLQRSVPSPRSEDKAGSGCFIIIASLPTSTSQRQGGGRNVRWRTGCGRGL